MEDFSEDDISVQYEEDGELVFNHVSLKVSDMLREAESIKSGIASNLSTGKCLIKGSS